MSQQRTPSQDLRYNIYCANKQIGHLKDVGVQAEEDTDYDYQRKIESISSHKTEGKKMGARFRVHWAGYDLETDERSKTIIDRGGKQILAEYLKNLMKTDNRRFVHLLNNQPNLAGLLKKDKFKEA